MAEIARAVVQLIPSFSGGSGMISKELSGPAERAGRESGDKAGRGFKGTFIAGLKGIAAPLAGIFAGTQVIGFFKDAVGAASDLEQSIGGVGAVFGDAQGEVHAFAKAAAENVGLSQNAYNGLAAVIGTGLRSAGVPMDELAEGTDALITRAADLAATFGGPVSQSSEAMGAALRGEFEPLRRYGVVLSQADINARAMADSGKSSAAALTAQEKAAATTALIMEQSAASAGQFASESDTLAGKQERLRARFDNVKASIGDQLLPAMSSLMGFLSTTAIPGFERLVGFVTGELIPGIASFAAKVNEWKVPILAVVGVITAVFLPHLIALGVAHTVTAAKAVAAWVTTQAGALRAAVVHSGVVLRMVGGWVLMATQSLIQAARMAASWLIAMGPVGWVIAIVIGLAILIIANWDKIVAWTKQAWSAVTDWLKKAWENIKTTATNVWNAVLDFFRAIPGKLTQFFLNFTLPGLLIKHWDSIKQGATEKWTALIDYIKGVPGRIVTGLGNLGRKLIEPGKQLLQGLITGIQEKVSGAIQAVKDAVGSVIDGAKNFLGIASPSKVFMELGGYVAEGLADGIESGRRGVQAATNKLMPSTSIRSNLAGIGSPGPGGGSLSGVTFNAPVTTHSPDELASTIVRRQRDSAATYGLYGLAAGA